MSGRIEKINSLIKVELAKIIQRADIFPPGVMVTVMNVKTSIDIKHATVSVDAIPQAMIGQVLKILGKNIYHLQQELNRKIIMRYVPKIRFIHDQGQAQAERIESILKEIKNKGNV